MTLMTLMMLMVDLIPSNSLVLRHPILHNPAYSDSMGGCAEDDAQ